MPRSGRRRTAAETRASGRQLRDASRSPAFHPVPSTTRRSRITPARASTTPGEGALRGPRRRRPASDPRPTAETEQKDPRMPRQRIAALGAAHPLRALSALVRLARADGPGGRREPRDALPCVRVGPGGAWLDHRRTHARDLRLLRGGERGRGHHSRTDHRVPAPMDPRWSRLVRPVPHARGLVLRRRAPLRHAGPVARDDPAGVVAAQEAAGAALPPVGPGRTDGAPTADLLASREVPAAGRDDREAEHDEQDRHPREQRDVGTGRGQVAVWRGRDRRAWASGSVRRRPCS